MVASPQNPPTNQPPVEAPTVAPTASQSSTSIKKWFIGGIWLLMLTSMVRSCQRPQAIAPQLQQAAIPAAQPQATPAPTQQQIDQEVIKRNALLGQAIEATQKQVDETICARSEFFLKEADRSNQPLEEWLVNKLAEVNTLNQQETVKQSVFSGSPDQISIARAYNGDAIALLMALQSVYEGKGLTLCSVQPAESILNIQQFTDQARLLKQQSAQSQLQQMTGGANNGSALP